MQESHKNGPYTEVKQEASLDHSTLARFSSDNATGDQEVMAFQTFAHCPLDSSGYYHSTRQRLTHSSHQSSETGPHNEKRFVQCQNNERRNSGSNNERNTYLGPSNERSYSGPSNERRDCVPNNEISYSGPNNERMYSRPSNERGYSGPNNERGYSGPNNERMYSGPNSDRSFSGPNNERSSRIAQIGPGSDSRMDCGMSDFTSCNSLDNLNNGGMTGLTAIDSMHSCMVSPPSVGTVTNCSLIGAITSVANTGMGEMTTSSTSGISDNQGSFIGPSCSNDSYRLHNLDSEETHSSYKFSLNDGQVNQRFPNQPVVGVEVPKMSLWAKVQQLPAEALMRVKSAYGTHFPIEVRHHFAQWIEAQPWRQIDEEDSRYEVYAKQLFDQLILQLETKIKELPMTQDSFLLKIGLKETVNKLKDLYSTCPLRLVSVVKQLLTLEESLVQESENPHMSMETVNNDISGMNRQIVNDIEALQARTLMTENDLKQLQHNQESFIIQYQDSLNINTQIQQLKQQNTQNHNAVVEMEKKLLKRKEDTEKQLIAKAEELLKLRLELATKHESTFVALEELQKIVVDKELISWKRKQQLSGNGASFDSKMLQTLQQWCEALAEMIWKNRQQVLQVEILCQRLPIPVPPGTPDILPGLNQRITGLLSSLVTSTFIVESQPPQVLKKESRFAATVRLLVGGKLNIHMTPPQVKATIISENQARGLLKNDAKAKEETSGEILNNAGTMEYHQGKGELSITFRNMQLKKIKRADKKGSEAVTEEKFCVFFQSDFQIGNGELMFQVWTLSLPVVVTVHGNQECNAMATVLWDNQFAEPGRTPFQVPDSVPWTDVIEMLNCKFHAMTGSGLSLDNKKYLASKVFGSKPQDDYSQMSMSWANFNKDTLPGRNFTFWEWFYAVMKLTKEHLKCPWNDGLINGFVSKAKAQDMLLKQPNGTFLLRFSDSEIGGITIAWVADDPKQVGERQVWNLAPYGPKDFSIRSLSDRIKDLPSLVCLYPNIPKEQAFGKYYSDLPEAPKRGDGYVPAGIMATIQINASPMNFDNPQTPQPDMSLAEYSPSPSVNPVSPQAVTSQLDPIEETDMETIQSILSSVVTDYNADDINEVNVSDFLLKFTPMTTK